MTPPRDFKSPHAVASKSVPRLATSAHTLLVQIQEADCMVQQEHSQKWTEKAYANSRIQGIWKGGGNFHTCQNVEICSTWSQSLFESYQSGASPTTNPAPTGISNTDAAVPEE